MITARLLNSEAQLNNYKTVGGVTFVNEDTVRVVIQLYNDEFGIRHIPVGSAVGDVTLRVNDSTGVEHNLMMTVLDAQDKSIWAVNIVTNNISGMNEVLVGGNLTFTLINDTQLPGEGARGIIFNALQRLIIS